MSDGLSTRVRRAIRKRPFVLVDFGAVIAFAVLVPMLIRRLLAATEGPGDVLLLVVAAVPALLLADVFSGLVHWWGDTFFDERTPILGPTIIHGFREHHDFPERMTEHGFLELNGASCLALLPPLAGAMALDLEGRGGIVLDAFVSWFALAAGATNQLHMWAHAARRPALVTWAQERGWVLAPRQHAAHHAPPHRRAYCVNTGWANRPLDRVDAFPRLERAVRAITG